MSYSDKIVFSKHSMCIPVYGVSNNWTASVKIFIFVVISVEEVSCNTKKKAFLFIKSSREWCFLSFVNWEETLLVLLFSFSLLQNSSECFFLQMPFQISCKFSTYFYLALTFICRFQVQKVVPNSTPWPSNSRTSSRRWTVVRLSKVCFRCRSIILKTKLRLVLEIDVCSTYIKVQTHTEAGNACRKGGKLEQPVMFEYELLKHEFAMTTYTCFWMILNWFSFGFCHLCPHYFAHTILVLYI